MPYLRDENDVIKVHGIHGELPSTIGVEQKNGAIISVTASVNIAKRNSQNVASIDLLKFRIDGQKVVTMF